jgi:hypothetical protein
MQEASLAESGKLALDAAAAEQGGAVRVLPRFLTRLAFSASWLESLAVEAMASWVGITVACWCNRQEVMPSNKTYMANISIEQYRLL